MAALVLVGMPAPRADAQMDEPESRSLYEVTTEKKHPGFFRRPVTDSPATELEHAKSLRQAGKTRKAAKVFRNLVHAWHDSAEAPVAQQIYADYLVAKADYHDAFEEYQYLVKYYAGAFDYEQVLEEQFKIANLVRAENETKAQILGGSSYKALPLYRQIVGNAPSWERAPEAQFLIGVIHESRKDYAEAVDAYAHVILRYPRSAFLSDASYRRAHCLALLSHQSPRDEEQASTALTAVVGFLHDYPSDPNADSAREVRDALRARLAGLYYDRAVYYDQIANKPQAAVIAYTDYVTRFPSSDRAEDVQKRIEVLQAQIEEKAP